MGNKKVIVERNQGRFVKGFRQPDEVKQKIRESKIGSHNPNFGKKLSAETRAKMSASRTGKSHPHSAVMIERHRESLKLFYQSPEGEQLKQQLSSALVGNDMHCGYHHTFSDETKTRMSVIHKKQWQDEEWADRTLKASARATNRRPTNEERALFGLLEAVAPRQWMYVGNRTFQLGRKNPDFVNVNGKKQIAEMYGDHFHKGQNPQDRIDLFAQFGYSTLIVWAHELKHPEAVMLRIKEFCSQEGGH